MVLLNLELVEKSPKLEEYVDILSPITSVGVKYRLSKDNKKYIVSHEMMAKPSVMAMFVYKDSNKLDVLAYHNGFSNPFAIPAGYVLDVPDMNEIKSIIDSKGQSDSTNIARDLLNKKKSVVDIRRKQMIEGSVSKPNMSDTQNRNVVLEDRIILGTNSVNNKNKAPKLSYRTEYIDESEGFIDYFGEFLMNE